MTGISKIASSISKEPSAQSSHARLVGLRRGPGANNRSDKENTKAASILYTESIYRVRLWNYKKIPNLKHCTFHIFWNNVGMIPMNKTRM